VPKTAGLRPTTERVRGAIFSVLGAGAVKSERVLDLFAGTGALGIEALSRGASGADFVEANGRLAQQLEQNLAELALADRCRVHRRTVERAVTTLEGPYGLVFADPPYGSVDLDVLMESLNQVGLVRRGGLVVVEHRSTESMADAYGRLVRIHDRRYGDTSVCIYSSGDPVDEGDLPG
jgi:16S rRNA (guanine966-N2)-methyltransferase